MRPYEITHKQQKEQNEIDERGSPEHEIGTKSARNQRKIGGEW